LTQRGFVKRKLDLESRTWNQLTTILQEQNGDVEDIMALRELVELLYNMPIRDNARLLKSRNGDAGIT